MFCPKCGTANETFARFCQSCGTDLSAVTPTAAVAVATYAGFWKRLAALLIDSVVVSVASGVISAATIGVGTVSIFVLPWLYEALMLSSEKQATLGKMALGMAVTDLNGSRITFARATGRHFAKWISALILGIGFLMAAFTERKQALHDMIAETLVVNRPL
jgi:uncharacterized RDD family membrane protein YckC